jgi:hypothetical protein
MQVRGHQGYEDYLEAHRCTSSTSNECLEETAYLATRSDGRRVKVEGVYQWRDRDAAPGLLLPHFLLDYMKLLRNAYDAFPDLYRTQLFNQIDFLVSERDSGAGGEALRAVDRNGALVWENNQGVAQGMEQAEYAAYFATVAAVYGARGDLELARGTMTYALRFARSFDMQAGEHTGGVRSQEAYCGAMRARIRLGYWFHARGRGIVDGEPVARTVLNQHLIVVRSILSLYFHVDENRTLVDEQFGSADDVLERLLDRAIGGLYQLAFSVGNTSVQRSRPPNIRQFMRLVPGARPHYWAYYQFHMETGEPANISAEKTCHYHMVSLAAIAHIRQILFENTSTFQAADQGWRLYEAIDHLFEGAGEPVGQPGSTSAVYQWYKSAVLHNTDDCGSTSEALSPDVKAYYQSIFGG